MTESSQQLNPNPDPRPAWVNTCKLTGLPVEAMTIVDCYLAAGAIHDGLAHRFGYSHGKTDEELLRRMSSEELQRFRATIRYETTAGQERPRPVYDDLPRTRVLRIPRNDE
jgi:hypothetical protein